MKLLTAVLATMFIANAHASYYATHCSNATGSVKWESGHNSNTIKLAKRNGGTLTLGMNNVRIDFKEKTMLDVQETNVCGFYSKKEIFAGKVLIGPSAQDPRDLTSVSENNEVETEVICTFEMNSRTTC